MPLKLTKLDLDASDEGEVTVSTEPRTGKGFCILRKSVSL